MGTGLSIPAGRGFLAGTLAGAWLAAGAALAAPSTHDVDAIHVENFIGTIAVEVGGNKVSLDMTGPEDKVARLEVKDEDNVLSIEGRDRKRDWRNLHRGDGFDAAAYPTLTIHAPAGTALTVEEAAGRIDVGDLKGDVTLDEVSLDGRLGDVKSAKVGIAGRGDLKLGDVSGALKIGIAGSGDVATGDVGADSAFTIAGSGDVTIGDIHGGLEAAIHGSGDATVQSVDGAVSIAINGSGDIVIREGRADPFEVAINGSGDVSFGGTAVNPSVAINGGGDVTLERIEGTLKRSGRGSVTVRSK